MINENGQCEYCGQSVLDGEVCTCYQAQWEIEREKRLENASKQIYSLFYDESDTVKSMLLTATAAILDGELLKITLSTPNDVKANIAFGSNKLRITRTITNKHTQEV